MKRWTKNPSATTNRPKNNIWDCSDKNILIASPSTSQNTKKHPKNYQNLPTTCTNTPIQHALQKRSKDITSNVPYLRTGANQTPLFLLSAVYQRKNQIYQTKSRNEHRLIVQKIRQKWIPTPHLCRLRTRNGGNQKNGEVYDVGTRNIRFDLGCSIWLQLFLWVFGGTRTGYTSIVAI